MYVYLCYLLLIAGLRSLLYHWVHDIAIFQHIVFIIFIRVFFFLEQKLISKFIHSVVHSKLHIKKVILNTLNSIKILTLQCSMTSKYRINTVLVKLNGDYMSSSILNFYCDIKHTLHDFEDDITTCFSR